VPAYTAVRSVAHDCPVSGDLDTSGSLQRTPRHLGEHLPPSRLYLDDVERIYDYLREVSDDVQIETAEHKAGSPSALRGLPQTEIHELELRSYRPFIGVDFGPGRIWLYAAEDDPASKGTFDKIREIVRARRHRLSWLLYGMGGSAVAGSLGGVAIGVIAVSAKHEDWVTLGVGIGLLVIAAAWAIWSTHVTFERHSTIVLRNRADAPGFVRRNRDALVLLVIGAVLGAVVTLITGHL
jgi:hypothetical protein